MNQLEICNAAIVRLGSSPIVALTDNNKRAKLCASQYDRVKADLLSNHPWRFAMIRKKLKTSVADTATYAPDPLGKWSVSFSLPSNYLRIYRVEPQTGEYEIQGNKLYANDSEGNTPDLSIPQTVEFFYSIEYMADVDEEDFRTYFNEVIILKLALDLSYSMVQSNELVARLQAQFDDALRNARLYNAQEAAPHTYTVRDWTDSRL